MKRFLINILMVIILLLYLTHDSDPDTDQLGNCHKLTKFKEGQVLTSIELNNMICHIRKLERQ